MEHQPWVGSLYSSGGFRGQKIAIIGYSHYLGKGGQDHEGMTVGVLTCVVSNQKTVDYEVDQNTPFFKKIADSFRSESSSLFWNSVIFMNLLPQAIGNANQKYGWGSHEQALAGSERLFEIVRKYEVGKVFVFSAKAWESVPDTTSARDMPLSTMNPFGFNTFVRAPKTVAFHLRHPQYATPKQLAHLEEAVTLALDPKRDFLGEIAK